MEFFIGGCSSPLRLEPRPLRRVWPEALLRESHEPCAAVTVEPLPKATTTQV